MHNTISRIIGQLYDKHRECTEGSLADYIPELTKADPDWFGISVFTTDGHGYSIGDAQIPFTIQSISKAFTYGLVLDEMGIDAVEKRIGVEPSGEAFNSISLDSESGRPRNPMINAGAIAATGMVSGSGFEERFERILSCFNTYAGTELAVDEEVYASERATGFRNRAIANLLRNFNMLDDPVDEALEVYFRQCSIMVNCRDLGLMAATLANGGVNPVTRERALKTENVEKVLSVMSTCGMYDYSGEWIFRVGLPAKSGVGGGIMGVLPGQLGVAVFSPLLDPKGNSVRGLKTFSDLSRMFNLHLFNFPVLSGHIIRRIYKLSEAGSRRQRLPSHHQAISEHGKVVTIVELQGDFFFSAAERLLRKIDDHIDDTETFILDFRRVGHTDPTTEEILLRFANELSAKSIELVIVDPGQVINHEIFELGSHTISCIEDLDGALERCEDGLIKRHVPAPIVAGLIPFHEFELFRSLTSVELSIIEGLLEMESFPADTLVISQGDEPDNIFLLAKGSVSIYHQSSGTGEAPQRIAAFCPGLCFGDLAVIEKSKRSADVRTDEWSTCYSLSVSSLRRLEEEHSSLYSKILANILRINVDRLQRCNQEISSLKRYIVKGKDLRTRENPAGLSERSPNAERVEKALNQTS